HALLLVFCFHDPPPTEIYTLSLHDALPISRTDPRHHAHARQARGHGRHGLPRRARLGGLPPARGRPVPRGHERGRARGLPLGREDRKSTRLNSSHVKISYAVFCLKKKKTTR